MTLTATPTRTTAWLERSWLAQYLDRQLSGEEAAWFESDAMDKPEILARIESDTRLRDALAADASVRHRERSAVGGRRGGATAGAIGDAFDDGGGFGQSGESALGAGSPSRLRVPAAVQRAPSSTTPRAAVSGTSATPSRGA